VEIRIKNDRCNQNPTNKPTMMSNERPSKRGRGRLSTSSMLISSPSGAGSYSDYGSVDQYGSRAAQSPMQAVPQFNQPLSFRGALVSSNVPPPSINTDSTQIVYTSSYADNFAGGDSASSFLCDDGMQGSQDYAPAEPVLENLVVDPDALHAFGIIDHADQCQLTTFWKLGYELGHDGRLGRSIATVARYMRSFMASSKGIKDANDLLEAEKLDLVRQIQHKETEVVAMAMAKDQEYGPRIESLEAEVRQKGLDIENTNASHALELERISRDFESAKEEMDRCQTLCTQKDATIDRQGTRISELEKSLVEFNSLKDQLESLQHQNIALSEAQTLSQVLVDSVNNVREFGMFHDKQLHEEMVCPVMCCSGKMMSMKSVVSIWAESCGNSDGSIGRTFRCVETGKPTTIAPQPQFEVVQKLASVIGINVEPPCTFEYGSGGDVTQCSVYDVLAVVSRVCKIYREKSVDDDEMVMLNGGVMVMFYLSDIEGTERKRLGFSVQKILRGVPSTVYAGRFRINDRSWNPFSDTIEFAIE